MLKQYITSKIHQELREAAVPDQGMAASFCSTEMPLLCGNTLRYVIFLQRDQDTKSIAFYNVLEKRHYFRLNRAKRRFPTWYWQRGRKPFRKPLEEMPT